MSIPDGMHQFVYHSSVKNAATFSISLNMKIHHLATIVATNGCKASLLIGFDSYPALVARFILAETYTRFVVVFLHSFQYDESHFSVCGENVLFLKLTHEITEDQLHLLKDLSMTYGTVPLIQRLCGSLRPLRIREAIVK